MADLNKARDARLTPEEVLKSKFLPWIDVERPIDAIFTNSDSGNVIGVANLSMKAPVILEFLKKDTVRIFLDSIFQKDVSVLIFNDSVTAKVRIFLEKNGPVELTAIPDEVIFQMDIILEMSNRWGGELNDQGEHLIDLGSQSPGPHFFVNLLLGNRTGYSFPLQTTPKSVVDRLGRGSFCSHAGTRVLASRWDMRQEENGFPANRQFYLIENGRPIFYSADPNHPNIKAATCRHSQNHTVISYITKCGLVITRSIFLLPQEKGLPLATEVQRIEIKNQTGSPRQLKLIYTGMFGTAVPHALYTDVLYSNIIMQSSVLKDCHGKIMALGVDYYPESFREDIRFHTMMIHQPDKVNLPREFCTDYNEFVGNGTLEHPEGLFRLSNRLSRKGPGFFALAGEIELLPRGTALIDNFTGLVSGKDGSGKKADSLQEQVQRMIKRFSDPSVVNHSLKSIKNFYHGFRSFLQVKTENPLFDTYVNYNLPFQILYQTFASRSFCQTQKGYREIGFREIQDIYASMCYFAGMEMGDFVKELLKEWCGNIFEFGFAYHDFYWKGKEPGVWSDDALWFIQALSRYIHLTGDGDILDQQVVIAGTAPVKTRTVYETVKAILLYSGEISIGKHGMPLLDRADWNDCLRLDENYLNGLEKEELYRKQLEQGKKFGAPLDSDFSESVMNAFLLKKAIDETILLAEMKQDTMYVGKLRDLSQKLHGNLQAHAWKEDFFARVLFNRYPNGEFNFLGAKGDGLSADPSIDGCYFLNSFSWAILSNTATEEQIKKMVTVVEEYLKSPYGLKLVTQADLGKVVNQSLTAEYFPGDRENGAVFKHASMMAVAAMFHAAKQVREPELAARLAEMAYWMIDLTLPYKTMENPYILRGNPRFCTQYNNSETGENVGPMLSGTASWLTLALLLALGIEYTPQGIRVDPILKEDVQSLEYVISFRKTAYRIRVIKPLGFFRILDGSVQIVLDGQLISGNLVPIMNDSKEHRIEVTFSQK